ncbi:MAG: NTP transferase domain-containing protein, partial [Acidobacteria bacterium]|nr:NTP transferase domain-containing protein [Acidobacteriota bacterium]NIM62988.1 NTP transferase domain-containing protein [Acidobacteriota bacterium]NIO58362.1 NTP transferase domain-containing protein [Acidobacteriota bacterium]NIQ29413.1 NTP transferase domain-containing protein [Acidobacteriota bacterium]NIQ84036.1 NTP transferase domain-containing protein [Acidobacteriota bacterium]
MSQATPADFTGIVVAAGRAERFGGPLPKQFLTISGRWVVEHSVDALAGHDAVASVVVVLAKEHVGGEFGDRLRAHPRVSAVVEGGATRSESVAAGL